MNILISKEGIIKEQIMDIKKDVSVIYGYNNSGKTTFLKALNNNFNNKLMKNYLMGGESEISVFIPTNRVIASRVVTENDSLKDFEDFINYQRDSYDDYELHIKRVRDFLMINPWVCDFICQTVKKIFGVKIENTAVKYSDGIENIINIYLNIIWVMTWNLDISHLEQEQLYQVISETRIYVLIDEIEMFLHVNVQSKLINSLKEDFKNCCFILTTHSPLLLTRYSDAEVYNIADGRLQVIDEELYYQDLDIVYEDLFAVKELPDQVAQDINYLGKVVFGKIPYDLDEINAIVKKLKRLYPNIYRKYNTTITKAQFLGECNGKAQTGKNTETISRNL